MLNFYYSHTSYMMNSFQIRHPTLINVSLLWNLGFCLIVFSLIQILSGLFLSFFISLETSSCLYSKLFIIKEITFGWLSSNIHFILPSLIFFLMYLHVFRCFFVSVSFYFSLWLSGVFIFILFMVTSFTGYCLVYGSMSYWALVVIQNILAFVLGDRLADAILFSSQVLFYNSILNKIFVYHYLFGLLNLLGIGIHVQILHKIGSSYGLFIGSIDSLSFSSTILLKDVILFLELFLIVFFNLGFYLEPLSVDSFVEVNFLKVPSEINPEWFLRFFFMVLKSISFSKSLGIFFMFSILFFILILPFTKNIIGNVLVTRVYFILFYSISWFFICFSYHFYGGGSILFLFFLLLSLFLIIDLSFLLLFVKTNNSNF